MVVFVRFLYCKIVFFFFIFKPFLYFLSLEDFTRFIQSTVKAVGN